MSFSVKVGERAPDFELEDGDGKSFRLSEQLGKKNVVVFFYPKDDSAGCTVEACTFRDSHEDFVEAGAEVVGISADSASSHKRFAERHQLPMRLLSDPRHEVAARYGVGKTLGFIPGRVTFLIDRAGIVRHVTDGQLRLRGHANEALELLRTLKG